MEVSRPLLFLIGKQLALSIVAMPDLTVQSERAAAQVALRNIMRNSYQLMNSMKTCNSVTFYFMKNSFSDISRKRILPNMTREVPSNNRIWQNAPPANIRTELQVSWIS